MRTSLRRNKESSQHIVPEVEKIQEPKILRTKKRVFVVDEQPKSAPKTNEKKVTKSKKVEDIELFKELVKYYEAVKDDFSEKKAKKTIVEMLTNYYKNYSN